MIAYRTFFDIIICILIYLLLYLALYAIWILLSRHSIARRVTLNSILHIF